MVGQITPLVEVAGVRIWAKAAAGHVTGCVLSAACLGLALGTAGLAIRAAGWVPPFGLIVGMAFAACASREAGINSCRLPVGRRQTPKWYLCAFGPTWGAFAWGADLGQGWTSRVEFAGFYAIAVGSALTGSPGLAALIMASFGFGRALPVLHAGVVCAGFRIRNIELGYLRVAGRIHRVNAIGLAAMAALVLSTR